MSVEARQRQAVERLADVRADPQVGWAGRVAALARLALGRTGDVDAVLGEKVDFCLAFRDCSDFCLNTLVRAFLLYSDRLSARTKERIREACLSARYYGGSRPHYPMFYNSENHHMCWAVAEYLAAQAFPGATFTFDGRTAREHRDRARFLIASWIDRRARWGYCEWNSSCYMGVNLLSLLNLVDLSDEPAVRGLARDAVTKLLADLAPESAGGFVWGAQARIYAGQLFDPRTQHVATALSILLGAGDPGGLAPQPGIDEVIATTSYRPPAGLAGLATELSRPLVSRERHRVEEDLFYSCRSAFWRPPIELTDERERQRFAPHSLVEVAIRTERRAEYLVSAAVLPAAEALARNYAQSLIWMGCLGGSVPVLTTHPPKGTLARAGERYWAGTGSMPSCWLENGVLAAAYAGADAATEDFTHALFLTDRFDSWRQDGRWFFGAKGDGWVGLHAPPGASVAQDGAWAGREIRAPGRRAGWVAAFGSAAEDGSLDAFRRRCAGLVIGFDDASAVLTVTAPEGVRELSPKTGAVLNGKTFAVDGWKQLDSPWVQAEFGSAVTRLTPPGEDERTLDFSSASTLMAAWQRPD